MGLYKSLCPSISSLIQWSVDWTEEHKTYIFAPPPSVLGPCFICVFMSENLLGHIFCSLPLGLSLFSIWLYYNYDFVRFNKWFRAHFFPCLEGWNEKEPFLMNNMFFVRKQIHSTLLENVTISSVELCFWRKVWYREARAPSLSNEWWLYLCNY